MRRGCEGRGGKERREKDRREERSVVGREKERKKDRDAHSLGVADLEKVDALRLNLDELALGVTTSDETNRVAFIQAELVHDLCATSSHLKHQLLPDSYEPGGEKDGKATHPLRQIDASLVGNKLEHSDMRVQVWVGGIDEFKVVGRLDVELGCFWCGEWSI